MSNIQFKCTIDRIAILDPKMTKGKIVKIGEIESYVKTDSEISLNIKLLEDLPEDLKEAVEKNPSCIRISEGISHPKEVVIIPSRPPLIT